MGTALDGNLHSEQQGMYIIEDSRNYMELHLYWLTMISNI